MKEGKAKQAHTRTTAKEPRKTAAARTKPPASPIARVKAKKTPAAHPKHSEVVSASQDVSPMGSVEITPEERTVLVTRIAYFRAEARGFVPGYELDDWYAAEAEITAQLARDS